MRLTDVKIGEVVRVVGFRGQKTSMRLLELGLFPGDQIRVVRQAPLGGPLLIEVGRREVALGRGVAGRIEVEPE